MKKLAFVLVGFTAACSTLNLLQNKDDDRLVTVGQQAVTTDEFIYAFNKNRSADSAVTKQDIDDYIDLYIKFKLKVIEAENRGMDTTDAFKKEYNNYINQLDNSYLQTNSESDFLVKEAFDRMQYELRASHILFSVEPSAPPEDTLLAYNKALMVRDSIKAGASFEEMAIAFSADPSARQNKGDLGYFTVFQMVYPFETAAYSMAIGSVSMPIRTRFGYHLIKLYDKRLNEGKVEVAHIMIRTNDKAKERAFEVVDKLNAGGDWDTLCSQYSEDAQSAGRGGELPPFSKSQIVPEFAEAAFALDTIGQISAPVRTAYGWHIIKLLQKFPVTDFAANENNIKSQVRRDIRSQISRAKMIERLAKENGCIESSDNVQAIINPQNHLFANDQWAFEKDSLAETVLFTIGDSIYSAAGLYQEIAKDKGQKNSREYLYEAYVNFKEESIINYEKGQLPSKYPDYKYLHQEYHDGILLFSIMEEEVWAKASEDTLGLKTFYEAHKSNYVDSSIMVAAIFSSPSRVVIDSIANQVPDLQAYHRIPANEKQLLQKQNNATGTLSLQLDSGKYVIKEHPVLQNLSLPYKQMVVEALSEWHYVLPLRDPLLPQPLSEIKGRVIADYQLALEEGWLSALRLKYPVIINESVLKAVYKKYEIQ